MTESIGARSVDRYLPAVGRALISVIFLVSGVGKIMGWSATEGYMRSAGMFAVPFFLMMATIIELGGGLSLLFGYWARIGAAALFLYLIPTTLVFHRFWSVPPQMARAQEANFLRNLAIMGGLLLVVAREPCPFKLGTWFARRT